MSTFAEQRLAIRRAKRKLARERLALRIEIHRGRWRGSPMARDIHLADGAKPIPLKQLRRESEYVEPRWSYNESGPAPYEQAGPGVPWGQIASVGSLDGEEDGYYLVSGTASVGTSRQAPTP